MAIEPKKFISNQLNGFNHLIAKMSNSQSIKSCNRIKY